MDHLLDSLLSVPWVMKASKCPLSLLFYNLQPSIAASIVFKNVQLCNTVVVSIGDFPIPVIKHHDLSGQGLESIIVMLGKHGSMHTVTAAGN